MLLCVVQVLLMVFVIDNDLLKLWLYGVLCKSDWCTKSVLAKKLVDLTSVKIRNSNVDMPL